MHTESPFRIVLLIVILLATSIAIFFRRKASRSSEKITYEREGLLSAIILRLSAALLLICTIAYLLEPSSISWASLPFWLIVRWFSVIVAFIGAFLMAWTLAALGNNLTDTVITRADSVLINHGPYRFVRHPYYSTTALLMAAVFVMTANLMVGTTSLVVLLLLVARTPKKEQVLIERFGQQYLEYQKSTGMFIPLLWRSPRIPAN
ncbi:MAG: isoprenylcysteine carboxylmethyltransferase family protein [Pirellulaceae bacterium]|nr:isoprenylcysteine carboxylmethyltransferase family protein [Pirellulaceae bacterium]